MERLNHALGDVTFHGEDVFHVAVIGFRPNMKSIGDIDELSGNPKFVARFAHAAFEHGVDVQLLSDLAEDIFLIIPLESER